jgi:hypothetical protein
MSCEKYLPLIDDLIEGELAEQNAEQTNLHIFNCIRCSAYYKEQKREKDIYARYLFDVEPPADLWTKFQTKITAETNSISRTTETSTAALPQKLNIFRFLRLYPAIGMASVLLIFGIGLWKITLDKTVPVDEYAAQNDSTGVQAINEPSGETIENALNNLSTKVEPVNTIIPSKFVKNIDRTNFLNRKPGNSITNKVAAIKTLNKTGQISSAKVGEKKLINLQPKDEQLQQLQLKNLESETARQIEKAELLLRSFRNSRVVDDSSIYDVGYEKQQARKLLKKNARLRQIAETYGTLYAREILDKVEPFLLDIANLENNPVAEKVLDIKERVKNQNIIASLQVY